MSYSLTEKSIAKVEPFLKALADLKRDKISWSTSDPNALAYKIRQGLKIAASEPEKYPRYSELKKLFKITVREQLVSAIRYIPVVEQFELTAQNFIKSVTAFQAIDIKEPMGVIGTIIANPNFDEYHFPDYIEISEKELNQLYKWTSKNAHFIVNSGAVIITKKEPPENLAWVPQIRAI